MNTNNIIKSESVIFIYARIGLNKSEVLCLEKDLDRKQFKLVLEDTNENFNYPDVFIGWSSNLLSVLDLQCIVDRDSNSVLYASRDNNIYCTEKLFEELGDLIAMEAKLDHVNNKIELL